MPVVADALDPDQVEAPRDHPLRRAAERQPERFRLGADDAQVVDPSQQLAWADGEMIRGLVEGARVLFTNEYEHALPLQKTGWTGDEVLARVGTWVTTRAADGVLVERAGARLALSRDHTVVALAGSTGIDSTSEVYVTLRSRR